ncbi:NitT/TauT family transport system permease protein [Pseudomonas sp. SORGH_AS 211]|uniref:ABC transporter permease n=1 Tax=Pseudomonas sp. SORGH_AS_0211 TaxID=3041796 RepID=UPI00285F9DF0|nr:ABC transporter permease subunit [Pseudomonas sp. SORGH_AS_0211]MDR6178623.1 NitT/TauT family transport system permease protein [Pseudomonas sp. SORGH_AS_0211]
MKTLPGLYAPAVAPRSLRQRPTSLWADALCLVLGLIALALIWHGVAEMRAPLAVLDADPMTLDLARLPEYALRTTLRMFIALGASLLFTFVFATLAAKSRKAELLILPAIDILQSVPILGFLTFTVSFFLGLFPGRQLGAECAAIFAIFTSQAWNMAFGFYQSLRTVPEDLQQVSRQFGLSPWRRFFRLELPFAIPGLVWNTMMSMSGGWFFVVASEAITVGDNTINLPGIGSWLALAIARQDIAAIGWAVLAMGLVILVYDQLFFRPVVAWADRFRVEQTASQQVPRSWVYDLVRRARLGRMLGGFGSFCTQLATPRIRRAWPQWHLAPQSRAWLQRALDVLWYGALLVVLPYGVYALYSFIAADVYWVEAVSVLGLGLLTMARVLLLIAVASLIWVPIGVWIGLRPGWSQRLQAVAQFLAAFPANVLFPVAVVGIVSFHLNPDIWLSPLMVLGTQWYILFNVIAGASVLPNDLREAARLFGLRRWQWWRQLALPAIFPYYVTGALTAAGGSWNASIVAEVVSWGNERLQAHGLGAYIAQMTTAGDFPRVALGIVVMSIFVLGFNRLLWRPLYAYAERRLRLD